MGSAVVGSQLVGLGGRSAENTLVSGAFGAAELGSFSIANQIPTFLCGNVSNVLWAALFTQTIHAVDDEAIVRSLRRLIRIIALLLFPLAALTVAAGPQVIAILLGHRWEGAATMLEIFMVSNVAFAITGFGQAILYARGRAAINFRIVLEGTVIRVLFAIAAPWIGIGPMCAGMALAQFFMSWRSLASICEHLHVTVSSMLEQMLWPALCALIAGAGCWLVGRGLPDNLLPICVNLVLGLGFFLALLFAFEREALLGDLQFALKLVKR
jgi:O-antigen/teichoic acid export membrane protein